MQVLVVGAGAMGRWAGRTLASTRAPAFDVAFADRDATAASHAADAVGGRAVGLDTAETFDVVCLAVPISAVATAVATHAERASRAMVDVAGVMAAPVEAMREHLPDRERASLHPLFSPENAPGNVAVVRDAPGPVTDEVVDAVATAGNHTFETDPEEHDTAMETVQAGAHTAVLAYALSAADVREEFATPVSRELATLVETVTGGTPQVYREIQQSFAGADAVADAADRIATADADAFEALYEEAGAHARRGQDDADANGDEPREAGDGGGGSAG